MTPGEILMLMAAVIYTDPTVETPEEAVSKAEAIRSVVLRRLGGAR